MERKTWGEVGMRTLKTNKSYNFDIAVSEKWGINPSEDM